LRLSPAFRYSIYATLAILFASGAVWLVADARKDGENGELWQQVAATLLMTHGGVAMITLLMVGALVPVHMRYGWRTGRNLVTGIVMATVSSILIATAFGLYYFGVDGARAVAGDVHTWLGVASPVLLVAHIWWGRRTAP
jgi:type IV secretory pathway VirB2 component (pilin)